MRTVGVLATIGQLLPVGLAAALSTVPVTVLLVIMMSPRRRAAAVPFAVGCVVGTLLVVLAASVAAQFLPEPRQRQGKEVAAALELVLGSALVLFGIRTWRHRHRSGDDLQLPSWAGSAIDNLSATPGVRTGTDHRVPTEECPAGLRREPSGARRAARRSRPPGRHRDLRPHRDIDRHAAGAGDDHLAEADGAPAGRQPRTPSPEEGQLISAIVLLMIGGVVIGSALQDLG